MKYEIWVRPKLPGKINFIHPEQLQGHSVEVCRIEAEFIISCTTYNTVGLGK
jgi:hypothetical protein